MPGRRFLEEEVAAEDYKEAEMSDPQGPMGARAAAATGAPPDRRERLAAWLQYPRRVIFLLIALFLAWALAFLLLRGLGDPLATLTGGRAISPEVRERLVQQYGLDQPLTVQFFRWLGDALRGDLGTSQQGPVGTIITDRLPNTLLLVGTAFCLALLLAAAGGLVAALVHWLEEKTGPPGSVLKGLARLLVFGVGAAPPAVLALFLLLVLAIQWRWLPLGGMYSLRSPGGLDDTLRHLVLPAVVLAAFPALLTAQAASRAATLPGIKGGGWRLLAGLLHGLGTLFGQTGGLISALVVIEAIFSWPGIGNLAYRAAVTIDIALLLGLIFVYGLILLAGRLLSELFRWLERLLCPPRQAAAPSPWRKKARWVYLIAALVLLLLPLGLGLAGLMTDPAWANRPDAQARLASPSAEHPWGTDRLGRDLQALGLRAAMFSLAGAGLAAALVFLPSLLGGALTGFLASLRRFWSESLADLLLLPADAMLLIPAILAVFLLGPLLEGWQVRAELAWIQAALAVAFVLLPRALRAGQTLWLAAPERQRWLTVGLAGPGALLLGTLCAVFGLGAAADFLGWGAQPPSTTLGMMLQEAIPNLTRSPGVLWVAGSMLWVCAVVFYAAADALVGYFTDKGVMARFNE
jgi:peptide/nickel transport system permease protein